MQSVTDLCDGLVLICVGGPSAPEPTLSAAEKEVVRLVLLGLSNRAIADARHCSSNTIANQIAAVYRKLSISGRRELRAKVGPR